MSNSSNTHLSISSELVGEIQQLQEGQSVVKLVTLPAMVADEYGLVHGGFIFGLADYAAMLAVNEPTVVLGSADSRFIAPVKVGAVAIATAIVTEHKGKKYTVECMVKVDDKPVYSGVFTCFVVDKHVLS